MAAETKKIEKKIVKDDELLERMNKEFEWSLLKYSDVQAAYLTGMFFQIVENDQQYILNTRGLQKKMRYLFPEMSKMKIEKIFSTCSEILFNIMDKTREKSLRHSLLRQIVEEKILNAEWKCSSEQLQLGFMRGYDLYWKIFFEKYPKAIKMIEGEEEEKNE